MSVIFVPSDDLMHIDDYGFIFPYRKLFPDFMVPEKPSNYFHENQSSNGLHGDFTENSDVSSPMNRLRRHICNFHLFGNLRPQNFQRELLISSSKRASRTRKERLAKNFLAKSVRFVLSELSHVEIDGQVVCSIKYGDLMKAAIRQVFLLNPSLKYTEDNDMVKSAIFKRASTIIRSYERTLPLIHKEEPRSSSTLRESEPISDGEECQVVPDITNIDAEDKRG